MALSTIAQTARWQGAGGTVSDMRKIVIPSLCVFPLDESV